MKGSVRLNSFNAACRGLVLPNGMVVDELRLDSAGSTIKHKPFQILMDRPAKITAFVGEASLAAFLEKESPGGLKGFKVQARDGVLTVDAKMKMVIDVPVHVRATLEIRNQAELHLVLQKVDVAGGPAKALVQGQIEKGNPLFEADDLPLPVKLLGVRIEGGFITLDGEALPPE